MLKNRRTLLIWTLVTALVLAPVSTVLASVTAETAPAAVQEHQAADCRYCDQNNCTDHQGCEVPCSSNCAHLYYLMGGAVPGRYSQTVHFFVVETTHPLLLYLSHERPPRAVL